jgi:hypothetical protein
MSDEKLSMILVNTSKLLEKSEVHEKLSLKLLEKSDLHEKLLSTLTAIAGGIERAIEGQTEELKSGNQSRIEQTSVFKTALETIGSAKPIFGIREILLIIGLVAVAMLAASKVINVQPLVDKYTAPTVHVEHRQEDIHNKENK